MSRQPTQLTDTTLADVESAGRTFADRGPERSAAVRPLAAVAAAATLLALALAATATPARTSPLRTPSLPRWRLVAHANVPTLKSVVAISASDVWTVGEKRSGSAVAPMILHWNGRTLRRFASFRPAAADGSLTAVAASAPDNVWAVGTDSVPATPTAGRERASHPVVLRWDARSWKRVPTMGALESLDVDAMRQDRAWMLERFVGEPGAGWFRLVRWSGPRRTRTNHFLRDVSVSALVASAPNRGWIVGACRDADGRNRLRPLILRWSGHSIRRDQTALDTVRDASLSSISLVTPSEIWAAGDHLLIRYSP